MYFQNITLKNLQVKRVCVVKILKKKSSQKWKWDWKGNVIIKLKPAITKENGQKGEI